MQQQIDQAVFEQALSVAQQFAASMEDVPRDVRLTALALYIATTFQAPRPGLAEFRGLVDALIEHMNKPAVN